jgi:ABC-type antimicrobial peptide transport system permease subunit
MDKKFGLYIILGAFIGALFGMAFMPVIENDGLAIFGGALAGVFLGWFIAAAVYQKNSHIPPHRGKKNEH